MSPKKHKLAVAINENYCVLGIASDEPDYKLCWLINSDLKSSFVKSENLILYQKKLEVKQEFSIFRYDDEKCMLSYRLIKNKSDMGYYLSDLKNIDYVLHIQGEIKQEAIGHLITKLSSIKNIRMCVPVELSRIKEKDRLELW